MTALLPCPFCGGPASIKQAPFGEAGYVVGCSHDGAADPEMCAIAPQSTPFVSPEAAAVAWNARYAGPAQRQATHSPHLWVPYPYVPGEAELCTLCGEFRTPENGEEACPETIDEIAELYPLWGKTGWDWIMLWNSAASPPAPPDGWHDEQRQV